MTFKHKAQGRIHGYGPEITGEFKLENNHLLLARIQLAIPTDRPIAGPEATLEYDDLAHLQGPFKIEPGSVVGPDQLRLLLVGKQSEAKAEIISKILPPLSKPLREAGEVLFFHPV